MPVPTLTYNSRGAKLLDSLSRCISECVPWASRMAREFSRSANFEPAPQGLRFSMSGVGLGIWLSQRLLALLALLAGTPHSESHTF